MLIYLYLPNWLIIGYGLKYLTTSIKFDSFIPLTLSINIILYNIKYNK